MWTWILANKEWLFSGVGVALAAAIVAFLRGRIRSRRRDQGAQERQTFAPPSPPVPSDIELRPQWFELSLSQQIPQIEIWFYVINHLPKSIELQSLHVSQFQISAAPGIESIPLPEQPSLPPRHTTSVQCRRALADTEVRAFAGLDHTKPLNARVSVSLRATYRHKVMQMTHLSMSVTGWVLGAP